MYKAEREALTKLNNDKTVVIHPAHKGGVIQNLSYYEY